MPDRNLPAIGTSDLQLPDDPKLAKQLQKLQNEYVRRSFAVEAGRRTGSQAMEAQRDLNVTAVALFAKGTEDIVGIVEQTGRSEMAQTPIGIVAQRRIEAMAKNIEDTVERTAWQIANKATQAYDTSPPPKKRGLFSRGDD